MDLDYSNPNSIHLILILILSLDWILDLKYFMDLDFDLDSKVKGV